MIRIIAGKFRSRQIDTPSVETTKPTMDRVRAGVFSALSLDLVNANILDLFSGSGSYGFEALSRGANKVTFVENNDNAFRVIQRNAMKLGVLNDIDINKDDVFSFLNNLESGPKYDIIFIDPPYKLDAYSKVIECVSNKDLLNNGGVLVLESDVFLNIDSHPYFAKIKEYKYGLARVLIMRK